MDFYFCNGGTISIKDENDFNLDREKYNIDIDQNNNIEELKNILKIEHEKRIVKNIFYIAVKCSFKIKR